MRQRFTGRLFATALLGTTLLAGGSAANAQETVKLGHSAFPLRHHGDQ